MSIKDILSELIPSYRVGKKIIHKNNKSIKHLEKKLKTLDNIEQEIENLDKKNEYLFWISQRHGNEELIETKKRVFANLPKASGITRSIQIVNNFILQEIRKICVENGIEFFLIGGTLLGAVRHQGFIPWDDDIDIGMMRKEYLKFVDKISDNPELIVGMTYTPKRGNVVAKVKLKDYQTFWVDIFVYDYIDLTNNGESDVWEKYIQKAQEYNKSISVLVEKNYPLGCLWKTPEHKYEIDQEAELILEKMYEQLTFFGHGDFVCKSLINEPGFIELPYKKDDIFPLKKNQVVFENDTYSVWANYEKYFEKMYGDIWNFPPNLYPIHESEYSDNVVDECKRAIESIGKKK